MAVLNILLLVLFLWMVRSWRKGPVWDSRLVVFCRRLYWSSADSSAHGFKLQGLRDVSDFVFRISVFCTGFTQKCFMSLCTVVLFLLLTHTYNGKYSSRKTFKNNRTIYGIILLVHITLQRCLELWEISM